MVDILHFGAKIGVVLVIERARVLAVVQVQNLDEERIPDAENWGLCF